MFISLLLTVRPKARVSMQAEMALKEEEAERQRKRIQELEEMQKRLEEALQQEVVVMEVKIHMSFQ